MTAPSPDFGPPRSPGSSPAVPSAAVGASSPAGQTPPPQLGVLLYLPTPLERELLGAASESTATVKNAIDGSPAALAGIRPMDVIEAVDGQATRSREDVVRAVQQHVAGEVITLAIRRGNALIQVQAELRAGSVSPAADMFHRAAAGDPASQYTVGLSYHLGTGTAKDPVKALFWLTHAAGNGFVEAWSVLAEIHETGSGVPQNPAFAREIHELLAAEGQSTSLYRLADCVRMGTGGPVDLPRALELYERAAIQGHAAARFRVGEFHATGTVVPRDDAMAFRHFLQSAEMGNAFAAARVGNLYATGTGVVRNDAAAFQWLTKAAKDNVAEAQHDLGAMYSDGRGSPQDFGQAALWLSAAAEQGYVPSMEALGRLYRNMQPPDYSRALTWLQKAADQGNLSACNLLGEMYSMGQGVTRDAARGVQLFIRAAEGGNPVAQYNLGLNYSEGAGVAQNNQEAVKWLTRAIADPGLQSDARAKSLLILGTIYESLLPTSNVPRNHDWALDYYRQAAELKLLSAQRIYGQRLRDRQNYSAAIQWLTEAATRGDRAAQNDLGTMYYNGQGVVQSREQAIAWWIKAYEQGSTTARDSLRKIGINAG